MRILVSFVCFSLLTAVSPAINYIPPSFEVLQVKTTIDWQEQTFDGFVTWMRKWAGWNVVVRWKALAFHGVNHDTIFTIQLEEAPVHVIVNEVFRQVSADITYHLTEHLMVISSYDDFNGDIHVRAYDLTDLILQLMPLEDPPCTDLRSMSTKESISTSFFGDVV